MKQELIDKVNSLCELAGVPAISTSFDLRGKVAGTFSARGKDVNIKCDSLGLTRILH